MLTAGVVLVLHSRGVWFWADDWDYMFVRGTIPQYNVGWLEPHNNHLVLGQLTIYRILFSIFGMRSFTPYAVTEVGLHLAIVVVLAALLRRTGAPRWVAVTSALIVAFFGLGANAAIFPASMNHVGAVLFGLVAVLVASGELTPRRQRIAVAALIASLTFSLTALAMVVCFAVFVALRHRPALALRLVLGPLALFVAWWLAFGRDPGFNNIAPRVALGQEVPRLPGYVWSGLTGTLGDGSGLVGAGPILVLVLLAGLLLTPREPEALIQLAWAGLTADIFQLLVVGLARFDFGPAQLGTQHYAYINMVLLSPAVAVVGTRLLAWFGDPAWRAVLIAAALFAAYALNGVAQVQKWQDDFRLLTGGSQELALGIVTAVKDGQQVLSQRNPDGYNAQLIPRYVATPQITAALPQRRASPQGLLNAESYFFTGVSTRDFGLARRGRVTLGTGFDSVHLRSGCQEVRTSAPEQVLTMETGQRGNEIVVWSDSTSIKTRLGRGGEAGPLVEWPAQPGAMHIATSAPDAALSVAFNGQGTYTICKR